MTINEMIPAFEAVLFASGEPVETDKFCRIFDIDEETVASVMDMLSDRYEKQGSAIKLIRLDFSYQLCTRSEYAEYIRAALDLRRRTPLSQPSLEVLAVIAYNQPVTKAYVEQVEVLIARELYRRLSKRDCLKKKDVSSFREDRCFTELPIIFCVASDSAVLTICRRFREIIRLRMPTDS